MKVKIFTTSILAATLFAFALVGVAQQRSQGQPAQEQSKAGQAQGE